jgi:hypothetical protein
MKSDYTARRKREDAEEEELETGEPIPDEGESPVAKKIPARRGKFDGKSPAQTETGAAPGGHMVLSSAKYLKTSPESQEPDTGKKKGSNAEPENNPSSLEGKLLNGGTGVGALAMGGACLWFVIGLMNDVIFFYPPILFVIGLIAFFKGLAKNE